MKQWIISLLTIALCLGLCACDTKNIVPTQIATDAPHRHQFGQWEVIEEPSCEAVGLMKRFCQCGEAEVQELARTVHRFTEPTCTVPKTCTACGAIEGEALGHCVVIDQGVLPGPTEDGLTEGKHCDVCGEILVAQVMVPATGSLGLAYRVNSDGLSCTITGMGSCKDTDVVIPAVYDGYIVTALGERAFYGCKKLLSIRLPDTITEVGRAVFGRCDHLEQVNIPEGLTYIGADMFWDCDRLTSFEIPEHVTVIKQSSFLGCDRLISITIPRSVTIIEEDAFCGCWRLPSIELPDSIIRIEDGVFADCRNLTSIVLPDSVLDISPDAFNQCVNLGEEYDGCRYLAFRGNPYYLLLGPASKDIKKADIQPGTVMIGKEAFWECYSLTTVNIPDSVREIGSNAFSNCSNLTEVTIPEGVENIRIWTFCDCSSLKSITIPNSVTYIGEKVFSRCVKLTRIYYNGTKEQWLSIEKEANVNNRWDSVTGEYTIYCTDGEIKK